jgi:hypothetical protein
MAERCENYHAIDLAWLGRQKMLRPGCASSIRWSHAGGGAVSVGMESSHDCVRLCYRSRAGEIHGSTCVKSYPSDIHRHVSAAADAGSHALLAARPAGSCSASPSGAAGVMGSITVPNIKPPEEGRLPDCRRSEPVWVALPTCANRSRQGQSTCNARPMRDYAPST